MPAARSLCRGFTLVEILVALAIVAVALAAGMRAIGAAADTATSLKQRTLALWVAQNQLAVAQIATPWPALGPTQGTMDQANATFAWRRTVSSTANPGFRRVEVVVNDPRTPDYALAVLSGYVAQGKP